MKYYVVMNVPTYHGMRQQTHHVYSYDLVSAVNTATNDARLVYPDAYPVEAGEMTNSNNLLDSKVVSELVDAMVSQDSKES